MTAVRRLCAVDAHRPSASRRPPFDDVESFQTTSQTIAAPARENTRVQVLKIERITQYCLRAFTGLANRGAPAASAGQREQRRVQRSAAEIPPGGCNLQNCHRPRRAPELPVRPSFASWKRERERERESSSNSQLVGEGRAKAGWKRNEERKERFNEIDEAQRSSRGEIHVHVVPIVCLGAAKISPARSVPSRVHSSHVKHRSNGESLRGGPGAL